MVRGRGTEMELLGFFWLGAACGPWAESTRSSLSLTGHSSSALPCGEAASAVAKKDPTPCHLLSFVCNVVSFCIR